MPESDLPVEGDECDSCRPFWARQNLPAQKLVALRRQTDTRKVPIVVCPYCDGRPLLNRRLAPGAEDNDGATPEDV